MNNNSENTDLSIEEDTTYIEPDSIIEKQEDTMIIEKVNKRDLINKKIEAIIDNFREGKTEEFKNMMKGLFNSMWDMDFRIGELESELEEIRSYFYRNELTDEDFNDILMGVDEEHINDE